MFMLPAYVDTVVCPGMAGLSILISMSAAGSILGGLSMARTQYSSGLMKVVLLSSLAIAAAATAFALVREYWAAGAFLVVLGFMNVVFSVSSQSLVQHAVDEDTRGRVMSSWFMLNRGGPALGTFFFGIVAGTHRIVLADHPGIRRHYDDRAALPALSKANPGENKHSTCDISVN